MIFDADTGDSDYAVHVLNITFRLATYLIGMVWDLTRCQRAGKSAGHSTRDRRDHVIERSGQIPNHPDKVWSEVLDAAVHTEVDRLGKVLYERAPLGWLVLEDLDF